MGALYVPCAGPVLAAIVVAGGTASIGLPTLVLTATFAIGTALPLLVFALAGRRTAERVAAFRRRQRVIQIAGGVTMIVLAVALVFNLPAVLQRAVPDYTTAMQKGLGANDLRSLTPFEEGAQNRDEDAESDQHRAGDQRQVEPLAQAGLGVAHHHLGNPANIAGGAVERLVDVPAADLDARPSGRADEQR